MKTYQAIITLVILTGLVLVGCTQAPATASDTGPMATAIAGTLTVMQTQAAVSNVAAATSALAQPTTPPTVAPTTAPTIAPTIAVATIPPTAYPTINAAANNGEPYGPSFRVGHVTDLNFTDGSFVDVKLAFTKQWEITNIGTATWPADTRVVATDDNPFAAGAYVIGQVVSPGQKVTIRLPLTCSEIPATYTGHFMLENPAGLKFGISANFNEPFWVMVTCHA